MKNENHLKERKKNLFSSKRNVCLEHHLFYCCCFSFSLSSTPSPLLHFLFIWRDPSYNGISSSMHNKCWHENLVCLVNSIRDNYILHWVNFYASFTVILKLILPIFWRNSTVSFNSKWENHIHMLEKWMPIFFCFCHWRCFFIRTRDLREKQDVKVYVLSRA